jgi:hypothetical protein
LSELSDLANKYIQRSPVSGPTTTETISIKKKVRQPAVGRLARGHAHGRAKESKCFLQAANAFKNYLTELTMFLGAHAIVHTGREQKPRMTEMAGPQEAKLGRRGFLRTLAVGATAAVGTVLPVNEAARADSAMNNEKRRARYRETDHVKAFYRVNRYPAQ